MAEPVPCSQAMSPFGGLHCGLGLSFSALGEDLPQRLVEGTDEVVCDIPNLFVQDQVLEEDICADRESYCSFHPDLPLASSYAWAYRSSPVLYFFSEGGE